MSDQEFITSIYDELLSTAGASMRLSDIRQNLVPEVAQMLADRPRNVEREAEHLVADHLNTLRQRRSNGLRRDLEYVFDYWTNPEEAANVEPILDRAYKLGTATGDDKTLRLWTTDDLNRTSMARYREAAEVMRAAREFDGTVQKIVDRMSLDGRFRLGDRARTEGIAA